MSAQAKEIPAVQLKRGDRLWSGKYCAVWVEEDEVLQVKAEGDSVVVKINYKFGFANCRSAETYRRYRSDETIQIWS